MNSEQPKWWLAPPGMPPEGPFSISEIRSRAESGPEGTDWQVCKEGSDQWHPLTGLPEFAPTVPTTSTNQVVTTASKLNNYLMWMHLSQFANLVVPFAGFVIPVVLWQSKKDEDDLIDRQGREITNWIIFCLSMTIASVLLAVLVPLTLMMVDMALMSVFPCLVMPIFLVLTIIQILFPILGALQGSKGEFYRYPMFFRLMS